ncbi:MAG: response regulator [Cyclobacteriaceae bacterium]|nr:response regulator [Cyclobacteriaceae bacterium]
MISVLYVDDEQDNLDVFVFNFYKKLNVHVALNGEDGLALLTKENVDIVVSDYKMPGMDGVTFLEKVHEVYSDKARVLLTGNVNLDQFENQVSNGVIHKILQKPWDRNELLDTFSQLAKMS